MVSDNLVDGSHCTAMRRRKGRGQGRGRVSQQHAGAHGHGAGDGRQVVASLVVVELVGSRVMGQGARGKAREGLKFTFIKKNVNHEACSCDQLTSRMSRTRPAARDISRWVRWA